MFHLYISYLQLGFLEKTDHWRFVLRKYPILPYTCESCKNEIKDKVTYQCVHKNCVQIYVCEECYSANPNCHASKQSENNNKHILQKIKNMPMGNSKPSLIAPILIPYLIRRHSIT